MNVKVRPTNGTIGRLAGADGDSGDWYGFDIGTDAVHSRTTSRSDEPSNSTADEAASGRAKPPLWRVARVELMLSLATQKVNCKGVLTNS